MRRYLKRTIIILLAVFLTVNIADFIMLQRFKSICKQEMDILNKDDPFNGENDKELNELLSEAEVIVSISNNPVWSFISIIPK